MYDDVRCVEDSVNETNVKSIIKTIEIIALNAKISEFFIGF